VLIRAYFDESAEGKAGHGFLAVAGYVLTGMKLQNLERDWKRMLVQYQLPYFHMAECNASDPLKPENVFSHLSEQHRDDCARKAIGIARSQTLHGAAYFLKQEDYQEILESPGFNCDSYSFLLWTALMHIGKWRDANKPSADLSLFFEQGYKTQPRANELLKIVSKDPRFKQDMRVTSHAFFNKENSYPGQAADLLAWHVRKLKVAETEERPYRKDTLALIKDVSVKTIFYDRTLLMMMRDGFIRHSGSLARAARILFNPNGPTYEGE
jgi:hypothetical protein